MASASSTIALPSFTRPSGASSALWLNLLVAAVLVGAGCRLAQYAADRSYWHDEACVVLNVRARTAGQLLQKLDYDQAAPPLFLWAERWMYLHFGDTEWSLRAMPTLVGVVATGCFALLAWRLMPGGMAVAVTAVFACSDQLIGRAVEVKPYGTDAFVAVLLTWLATTKSAADRGAMPATTRCASARLATVMLAGTAAVWFSYSAILVLAALGLGLLPALQRERPRSWLAVSAACAAPLAISFAALFWMVIRAQQTAALRASWQNEFADPHRPWTWPVWIVRQFAALCDYPCQPMGPIIMIAVIVGVVFFWRQRRGEQLLMLIGPILITMVAAVCQRYPLDGSRLNTFLTPDVLLLAGIGARAVLARRDAISVFAAALFGATLAWSMSTAGYHLFVPRYRAHLRPIAEYVAKQRQAGDQIFPLEDKEFACYWPIDDPSVHTLLRPADQMPRQFWIVWSPSAIRRPDGFLDWARSFATEKDRVIGIGGGAYRFDRTGHRRPAPAAPPTLFPNADRKMHARPQPVFGQ